MPTAAAFLADALANPVNAALLERLAGTGLPQCHLTAGCLFQAVWNRISGHPPGWGVKDYDIFYFDGQDTSWESEDGIIRQISVLTADLGVVVEVRNQARVHLWYERRFGSPYPQLLSARDGIDRYLIECTCIGIDAATRELYAPNGLRDVAAGILRLNPLTPSPGLFRAKADAYRARWPWLTIAG